MADVMCPLSFEDLDALLADEQLPSELTAVFEDSARTIELTGGYEMELTEAEARADDPAAPSGGSSDAVSVESHTGSVVRADRDGAGGRAD